MNGLVGHMRQALRTEDKLAALADSAVELEARSRVSGTLDRRTHLGGLRAATRNDRLRMVNHSQHANGKNSVHFHG
jgi:hypothetical protein